MKHLSHSSVLSVLLSQENLIEKERYVCCVTMKILNLLL